MKYIYKVVGNFDNIDFEKILAKISQKFIYIYVDKTLFIALKSYEEGEDSESYIVKILKPSHNFYIEEVTEKNIAIQQPFVKEWCLNNFVRLDTERYEKENQERLKQVWYSMDKMEIELQQKLLEQQNSD